MDNPFRNGGLSFQGILEQIPIIFSGLTFKQGWKVRPENWTKFPENVLKDEREDV